MATSIQSWPRSILVWTNLCVIAAGISLVGCQTSPTHETARSSPGTPAGGKILNADVGGTKQSAPVEPVTQYKTVTEAQAEISKLGVQPTPEQLAELLSELDTWFIAPSDQESFQQLQLTQLIRLRGLLTKAIEDHQAAALKANTSKDGAEELDTAAQLLLLYPMSRDRTVIDEARRLSNRQIQVTARLEALRRQRYNRWAIDQIEKAIDDFNKNAPFFKGHNPKLVNPIVTRLGPIDPILLEPVVQDLYSYIIDKTNDKLSENSRLEFARKLTAPSIERRKLGDL